MKKRAFIIHSSEIVRRGLTAILRSFFNAEYIQLTDPLYLKDYAGFFNQPVLVLAEADFRESIRKLSFFNGHKPTDVVLIFDHDIDISAASGYSAISLKQPSTLIYDKVYQCFISPSPQVRNFEGEELTYREKEVLKLVALGLSNKEIAANLNISIHTVISHRKNLTEKLGIKSISGLTVYAIIHKLIDTSSINPEDLI